jgi:transposase
MTPLRARAPKGERVVSRVPRCRGTVTTVLGALTLTGVTALMTIEGATSGPVFTAFAKDVLAPTLRKGDVVVMDNLGAHKVADARDAIEAAGARLLFQPPYAPEVNPIEHTWSKVKNDVRKAEPRTVAALDKAIAAAADNVTPSDAVGWFGECGYQINR